MLDVVYFSGIQDRVCIDISIVDSVAVARQNRPFKPALQRREQLKHRRYPYPGLVPFALDINGRWGAEAETWLRRVVGELPDAERNTARCALRSAVSLALQSQVAEQVALATNEGLRGAGVAPGA